MAPRRLGVGLVYWPALDPVFEAGPEAVAVLELEPQGYWEKVVRDGLWSYRANDALLDRVAAHPQAKLLHGVGQPLGGASSDPVQHLTLLRDAVRRFDPAWVSEHLSVNRVSTPDGPEELGFLLPPRQSEAGVRVAAARVRAYGRDLGRPVAFETGVSYLRPGSDELQDGVFFAAVSEAADCGILLDLHNLWCNEVNGRARVRDVLAAMPLERVWEVHLAGGSPLGGYLLDAHDSLVPQPLMELAAEVLPRLPGLGAVNFEVLPQHVDALGLDAVVGQLDALRELWRMVPSAVVQAPTAATMARATASTADVAEVQAWERRLAAAVSGPGEPTAGGDPGFRLYRELVSDFRSGHLARVLRYTLANLLATLGRRDTRELLETYQAAIPPDSFPAVEADHFAQFLRHRTDVLARVPFLDEVLSFEHALVRATLFGAETELVWSVDPTALLGRLDQGLPPGTLQAVHSTMRVEAPAAA